MADRNPGKRTLWQKLRGHYPCKPVAVRDISTGELLGDYGEGKKSWFHSRHCCGSLCKEGIRFDPSKHVFEEKAAGDSHKGPAQLGTAS